MLYIGFEFGLDGLKKEGVADRAGFEPALGYYPKHAFQPIEFLLLKVLFYKLSGKIKTPKKPFGDNLGTLRLCRQ